MLYNGSTLLQYTRQTSPILFVLSPRLLQVPDSVIPPWHSTIDELSSQRPKWVIAEPGTRVLNIEDFKTCANSKELSCFIKRRCKMGLQNIQKKGFENPFVVYPDESVWLSGWVTSPHSRLLYFPDLQRWRVLSVKCSSLQVLTKWWVQWVIR